MPGVARPHLLGRNRRIRLQGPMVIPKSRPANLSLSGGPPKQGLGLFPSHAGIGYRNSVLQTFWPLLGNILPTLLKVTFQHQTQNPRRARFFLFDHAFPGRFLLGRFFSGIRMTAVHHQSLR